MKTKLTLPLSQIPLFGMPVSAGFPTPVDDFIEQNLDLNQHLIPNRAATFLVRVQGESMIGADIFPEDILIVDRSKTPVQNDIVIAIIENEFTVKRLVKKNSGFYLQPENDSYKAQKITEETSIWGVVTWILHHAQKTHSPNQRYLKNIKL